MRITMVNKYYPPHVGGIESHVRDLAEGLAAAGNCVRVVCSNDNRSYAEDVIGGVEIVRLPRIFERASTPIVRNLGSILNYESQHADILHFHFPYPWGEFEWVGQLASKTQPYVVTYHSDIIRQKKALAAYSPFLNKFLNRSRLIMASSPQLIEYSPWLSTCKEKCHQVNFGIPGDRIAYNSQAAARAAQLREQYASDGKPLVLFVGRLIYYKGIEVLAKTTHKVDANFIIIGKGSDCGLLADISPRTHIIDYVDDDELVAWYHAADVLVLPSIESSEAFGLVQIEAHAAGTPTVSSRLKTGIVYANLDGVTGLTVAPRNADVLAGTLSALLADNQLRTRLGQQAQKRVLADFTVPRMVQDVTKVYQQALSESVQLASADQESETSIESAS